MDFLDIRKKAKERARARAEEGGAARAAAEQADPAPARSGDGEPGKARPRRARSTPAAPDLAACLRALPPAEERGPAPGPTGPPIDERFTTWRPGEGAPPFVPPPPAFGPLAPPDEEDFTVLAAPAAPAGPRSPPPPPPPAPARSHPAQRLPLDPLDEFFYRPDEEAPDLPALAEESAPRQERGAIVREEYLTFVLGREEYAVAVRGVREVIRAPPVTEVPRAPAHVLGVVTVRGEVVAVIDPRRRLTVGGAAPGDGEGKIVILDTGDGPCGLLVDRVSSVVRLAPGSIEPCPQGIAAQSSECVAGIGREDERIFTVLDVAGLLRRTPARGADGPLPRRPDAGA